MLPFLNSSISQTATNLDLDALDPKDGSNGYGQDSKERGLVVIDDLSTRSA